MCGRNGVVSINWKCNSINFEYVFYSIQFRESAQLKNGPLLPLIVGQNPNVSENSHSGGPAIRPVRVLFFCGPSCWKSSTCTFSKKRKSKRMPTQRTRSTTTVSNIFRFCPISYHRSSTFSILQILLLLILLLSLQRLFWFQSGVFWRNKRRWNRRRRR